MHEVLSSPAILVSTLAFYGYALLLPLSIIEGPFVTILAGFLAAQGLFNFFTAFVVVLLGDIIGDILYYVLGRYGGRGIFSRYIKRSVTDTSAHDAEAYFKKRGGTAIVVSKLTHAYGIIVLPYAGMMKYPFSWYIWYCLVAAIPKCLVLLLVGYFFGTTLINAQKFLDYGSLIAVLVLLGAVIFIPSLAKKYIYLTTHDGK